MAKQVKTAAGNAPAPEDEEVDVTVDEPNEAATTDALQAAGDEGADDVDGLKAALAEAQRKAADNAKLAQEADRRLNEERAQREADKRSAKTEVSDARLRTVTSALEASDTAARDLKGRLAAAYEAGDGKQIAELTLESSLLAAKRQRLEEGKSALESLIEQEKTSPQMPTDPIEDYTRGLAPRAKAWVKSHAEVVTDPVKRNELERAHWRAKGMGYQEGSDDYFQYIEGEMGYGERFEVDEQPEQRVQQQPTRRTPPPAAPVSRDASGGNGASRPNQVRLTAAEREAARIAGMSDTEYARQKLAIERERNTTH